MTGRTHAHRGARPWPLLRAVLALLAAFTVLPLNSAASGAQVESSFEVTRLWGQDRYATSVAVARRFVQESGGRINTAVLVSGTSWSDAVIAAGLAGSLNAPVLLTRTDEVPSAVADFVSDAGVSRVMVVGSTSAVSVQALASLDSVGRVERVSGAEPSAASVAVARRMGTPGHMPGHGRTVVVASSETFADAMVAGGFSARGGHPVLLTAPDALDQDVARYVSSSGTEHVIIMGGTAAVSSSVQNELEALGVTSSRLGGQSRLETAQFVAEFLESKYSDTAGDRCFDRSTAGLATAWVPFDAFSAGPLLGKLCAPLLLTDSKRMNPDLARWIFGGTGELVVFGGPTAVSSRALTFIDEAAALQDVFDIAADRRAEIVTDLTRMIKAGSYGVDIANVLHGPENFSIVLDHCPNGWSDTGGISGNQIRIGHTTPLTGSLAVKSKVSVGIENYFDWVNRNDPVAGMQIKLVTKDDRHIPSWTVEQVDTLLAYENVFSILTLGTPNTLSAYDKINHSCVPHPFVISTHPAWGDPEGHPWTTGMPLSYSTEAVLWGTWIERNLRDKLPVKVAGLAIDNPFGNAYEDAFEAWAREHPDVVSEFVAVRHDPAQPRNHTELAAIQTANPDVYISMTQGRACRWAVFDAGESGLILDINARGGALFMPSVCRSVELYMEPAGEHADGWWIADSGLKNSADPDYAAEPFIKFLEENLAEVALAAGNTAYETGYAFAYPYVEALRIANELPGGLTRSNFILAVRSLDISHPMYVDGIRFRLNGRADAYFVEGAQFSQYNADDDVWRIVGPAVDVDGQTPNCAWNPAVHGCR